MAADDPTKLRSIVKNTFIDFEDDENYEDDFGPKSKSTIGRLQGNKAKEEDQDGTGLPINDMHVIHENSDLRDSLVLDGHTYPERTPKKVGNLTKFTAIQTGDKLDSADFPDDLLKHKDLKPQYLDIDRDPSSIAAEEMWKMGGSADATSNPWSHMPGLFPPGMPGYGYSPSFGGPQPGPPGMSMPGMPPPFYNFMGGGNPFGMTYGDDYYGQHQQGGYSGGKGFGKGKGGKSRGRGSRSKNANPEEEQALIDFERSIGIIREDHFVPEEEKTTLMFQNIPNKFRQTDLLQEINQRGFHGKYDFFYLPMDFQNRCNVGYAFINFVNVEWAKKFEQEMTGVKLSPHSSKKQVVVAHARTQGWQNNVNALRNSPVNAENAPPSYKPLIFDPDTGASLPFPKPEVATLPQVQLRNRRPA